MNGLVRRILSGVLMLAGLGQAGCKGGPFLACLSIAEPPKKDADGLRACLSLPTPADVPQPPAHPCLSVPMHPCLSVAPKGPPGPPPPATGQPDASSDARRPSEPREVLASLSDRLPDDVKARLGLTRKS